MPIARPRGVTSAARRNNHRQVLFMEFGRIHPMKRSLFVTILVRFIVLFTVQKWSNARDDVGSAFNLRWIVARCSSVYHLKDTIRE